MERIRFPLGQEPKVLTSISEECDAGSCESCPDIFHRDDYPGESIFCIHSCHKEGNQGELATVVPARMYGIYPMGHIGRES